MPEPRLYGIPKCDQVRKARSWLGARGVAFIFHDFRRDGLDAATLERWIRKSSRDRLLNRKGATWRALDENVKAGVHDDARAMALMLERPTVIKRPVVELDDELLIGFEPQTYARAFLR